MFLILSSSKSLMLVVNSINTSKQTTPHAILTYSLMTQQHTFDEVFVDLQNNASEIGNYSLKNSLTIYPEKCEMLIITKKAFIGPLPAVTLSGKQIKVVQHSAESLFGVIILRQFSTQLKRPTYVLLGLLTTSARRFQGFMETNHSLLQKKPGL